MTPSPDHRVAPAGLSAGQVAIMGVTVASTVTILAFGLGGLDLWTKLAAQLPERAIDSARAESVASAAGSGIDLSRLAGRWRAAAGDTRLIVTRRGEVWSDAGAMQGTARPPAQAGTNFAFGDGRFFCAYAITFKGADDADWRLVDRSADAPCPSGTFHRPAVF